MAGDDLQDRPDGLQYYEERHRQEQIRLLKKRAATLGFLIVEPQVS